MAWLSLDHLRLPFDKSAKHENIKDWFACSAFGGVPMRISQRDFVSSVAGAHIASVATPNPVFVEDSGPAKNFEP
jgi:hypothetical protein